ncbi:universal stress protein [Methanobacterium paludis]|uniref:UspA domain-containing protein n=1 Tax=Methanobacterium paludis (strain DSM 25820 / JCM 18151 / SWAN1) TaxID=868131 RepID=F6D325_METPW|nr:universal stress protein [Methanobacterium paludis]AEG17388.1 UspA domain-containing protein [Methanobacterium paludis]
MNTRILLPTDGSESSKKAGEYAVSTANLNGADIIVLNVIDTDYLNPLPQRDLREKLDEQLREEGKEAVEKFKKKIEDEKCAGNCKNINLITMLKQGKPSDVILETAEEEGVDQIIIGKSGKHGLERFLLGSTTERVVRKAKIPVNVIV